MSNNNDFGIDLFGEFKQPSIDSALKLPLCLVLDSSYSMSSSAGGWRKTKIGELNENVQRLLQFIKTDSKASRICDVCIISFGGTSPKVVSGYSRIDKVRYTPLDSKGATPMGQAVDLAVELLQKRRKFYRENGIEHYKPIMMLMTDGEPTDHYATAARNCSSMVINKELKIYPVGVGNDFNVNVLSEFSPILPPKRIDDIQGFMTLFDLLSRSSSNPNDDSLDKWFKDEL